MVVQLAIKDYDKAYFSRFAADVRLLIFKAPEVDFMAENLFLETSTHPSFSQFKAAEIVPAVETILAENIDQLNQIVNQTGNLTWESVLLPLTRLDNRLKKVWSPIQHLNSVKNTPDWREAYEKCLPKLTEYHQQLSQNKQLYQMIQKIAESKEFEKLEVAKKQGIQNNLRDFKLAGIHLDGKAQAQFNQLQKDLEQLSTQFSNHVMDATDHWYLVVESADDLSGVPESALALMAVNAKKHGQQGYRLSLDFPCYYAVMQYADNEKLRRIMHEAYATRASDLGPDAGKWDNTPVMSAILEKRQELATLLGYASYAHLSLAKKMAPSPEAVIEFLEGLVIKAKPRAQEEWAQLQHFAKTSANKERVEPWDIAYYSEKLCRQQHDISPEMLRPYFPLPHVMSGLFHVVTTLFQVHFKRHEEIDTWHECVEVYEILNVEGESVGWCYMDLFARPHKQGGAWMDSLRDRGRLSQTTQTPMAYVTCNFEPPLPGKPALLTHDELLTLFHEFGHAFHHLLTQVDELDVSGINGVSWDAVELPSQLMENFCWQPVALQFLSKHVETGESLPENLLQKLLNAKHFQCGLQLVRQLEFSLFDFKLHQQMGKVDVQDTLDRVRQSITVVPISSYNRFQHGFTHIFAGGYAAGYYGYLWAEVLSADAFSIFEKEGVLNPKIGKHYLTSLLSQGGARPMMELFEAFCGRALKIDAFLKERGLQA